MLTGTDLLTKVKELGDVPSPREGMWLRLQQKDGGERLNFTALKPPRRRSVNLSGAGAAIGQGGRKLSVAKVRTAIS